MALPRPFRFGIKGSRGKYKLTPATAAEGASVLADGTVGYPTPAEHSHESADVEGLDELITRVAALEAALGTLANFETYGDLIVLDASRGLVLTGPDGRYYRLTFDGLEARWDDLGTEPPDPPQEGQ